MFPTPVLTFKPPVMEEERLQDMLSHHLRSEGRDSWIFSQEAWFDFSETELKYRVCDELTFQP